MQKLSVAKSKYELQIKQLEMAVEAKERKI